MAKAYLIPGLVSDGRIFRHLSLDIETTVLEKPVPYPKESLEEYAKRFIPLIKDSNPVLIGVSLGGVIAQEIAAQLPKIDKVILIASIKAEKEKPSSLFLGRNFPLHQWVSVDFAKKKIAKRRLRLESWDKEQQHIFLSMLEKASPVLFRWGISQVAHWKPKKINCPIFHLHGTKDLIFPYKYIQAPITISGGTHFMLGSKGEDISIAINKILSSEK